MMTIEEQLQAFKDIRHVLTNIKRHAILPNAQDYRATNRDAIESLLSVGLPLIDTLIADNAERTLEHEEERAKEAARAQVASDMPYVQVDAVRLYQYHADTKRWYVEVDVTHHEQEQGAAIVLCRVSYDANNQLSAMRVTIAEQEEENETYG